MESDRIRKYQEFLKKVVLHDQTYLVNALIERDEYISPFNDIHNKEEYEVELSDGKWIGTQSLLHVTVCEMQKELEQLTQTMNDVVNIRNTKEVLQRKATLEADLKKLDSAIWKEREIFEWLLVPQWIADRLINLGEVVLRAYGSNWWGISSLYNDSFTKEEALLFLFEDTDYASEE